ncbi:carbon-nitrogen hydrolase family protein [Hyphococcus sp.]|uniref:carbon-nitrogen hydrolase family protein n=1 Tax=Hyphococcus sp. TaxID=2038636 RepID=UPI003D11931D
MTDRKPFLAACVQMRSGLDRAKNAADACTLIAEAAGKGAQFIATPEMTNVVDRKASRLFETLPDEDGLAEIGIFSDAAKAHGVWLLIGSMAVRLKERRAANRAFLFAPDGSVAVKYDKLHMFDVDLPNGESWKESNVYQPGDKAVLAETPLAKLGLTICYDVRFPYLYRQLAQAGAEVLCVPAAFTRQTGIAHWKTLLTARAIETGSFVVAPAQGGTHEDGRETYGHSLIIGPWGEVLAEAPGDEPGIVLAEINPAAAKEARQRIPNLALEQSFKLTIVTP